MRASRWLLLPLVAGLTPSLAALRAQQPAAPAPASPALAPERFDVIFADLGGAMPRVQAARSEMKYAKRSTGCPFGGIEIRSDAQGKGKGVLVASAQLGFGPAGSLDVKSFGAQPFQLMEEEFNPLK